MQDEVVTLSWMNACSHVRGATVATGRAPDDVTVELREVTSMGSFASNQHHTITAMLLLNLTHRFLVTTDACTVPDPL
jgi:hypothetical protein